MRKKRIEKSTQELDQIENKWWNDHADTIEKIWAQSYELQKAIRLPYLSRAKKFFLEGNSKRPVTIWEVGCGSGWVCRLIADKDLHVIGTDFSSSQIEIATKEAQTFNKEEYCKYILTDASTEIKDFDGVLIHAILHHLSQEELVAFFKVIEKIPKGTRVFMFEPVFTEYKSNNGFIAALAFKQVIKLFRMIARIGLLFKKQDKSFMSSVHGLFLKAEKEGWFLSPKEVPFYESELNNWIDKHFTVERSYFVNKTELEVAQYLVYRNIDKPGFLYRKFFIPVAIALDKIFFSMNFRAVTKGQYFFKCFELIAR